MSESPKPTPKREVVLQSGTKQIYGYCPCPLFTHFTPYNIDKQGRTLLQCAACKKVWIG